jgi:NADH-quinone oxidoreductase subunit E
MNLANISDILQKYRDGRGGLIAILEEIQSLYGYLPQESLEEVARNTGRSLVDVYGVATFYGAFSLQPRGKHLVSVCLGTACHVRSAPMVAEEFERQLHINAGETTADREFTLDTVACLGACALGPIVVVDGHYFSNVDTVGVKRILRKARRGIAKDELKRDERVFAVELNCPRCNHSLMDDSYLIDDQPSVRMTASFRNKHGWLRLSSLYGSYTIATEEDLPMDAIIHLFCPHCHAELVGPSNCVDCGAPMVPMIVRRGGMVQICSRRGCNYHMLDLNGENL